MCGFRRLGIECYPEITHYPGISCDLFNALINSHLPRHLSHFSLATVISRVTNPLQACADVFTRKAGKLRREY